MKTSIKLVLFYFGFQVLGVLLATLIVTLTSLIQHGTVTSDVTNMALAPAMLFGFVFMTIYLWKAKYISSDRITWSPVSISYLILTVIIYYAMIFLVDFLMSFLTWLPNFAEQTFDILESGWLGIICIALLGPILEELLFRGAITKVLLKKYNPTKAIVLSALIFGVFHLNPAQIVTAFLIGLLLGWIYYKTASLIPCILVHVINNSLSVYVNLKYPDIENTSDLFSGNTYAIVIFAAVFIFAGTFWIMNKMTVPYPWKDNFENR